MDFKLLLLVILIASYYLQFGDSRMTLSIKDFLLDSNDTNADYSQAFQAAWKALCQGKGRSIIIHANEAYTIQPQLLQGPCVSGNLHIQIDGKLEAPTSVKEWGIKSESWLCFEKVTGLVLNGSGLLDAHGASWWSSVSSSSRPTAVRFTGCNNLLYNGLVQRDSPSNHISISGCTNATLSNLHIIAPANSPNTDGIDIASSHNIHILSSSIQTGDDCVAINGGSFDINITRVACGPGHGISVGSLGKGGAIDTVQNVNVRNCTFTGTLNGARIKTWSGGRGFAKNILYEDITLINARFPIIIDQQYCSGGYCKPIPGATAVKVSDVTFRDFRGTCADTTAIKVDCDRGIGCDNIFMEHINITSSSPRTRLSAYCRFAHVISRFVSIVIRCVSRDEDPQSPSPSPSPLAQPPAPHAQPPAPHAQPSSPHAQPLAPLAQPPPAPHAQTRASFFSFLYIN